MLPPRWHKYWQTLLWVINRIIYAIGMYVVMNFLIGLVLRWLV